MRETGGIDRQLSKSQGKFVFKKGDRTMLFGILARSKSTGRRWTFLVAQIVAILSVPMIVLAFPSPPAGLTGATGDGTCASCHSGSMVHTGSVSVTFSGGLSYTPGVPQPVGSPFTPAACERHL